MKLWSMPSSGNSYKVRLLLAKLRLSFEHVAAEQGSGVTQAAEFRRLNPKGKVPLLALDDGRLLSESNAILLYLADGTRFLPADAFERARVAAWMFWEQNAHETTIAVRAGHLVYDRPARHDPAVMAALLQAGHDALAVMEEQLARTPFLAGDTPSVADLCLYAYTHSAEEKGGFELPRFPAVKAWLARVEADDGHVPLDWLP